MTTPRWCWWTWRRVDRASPIHPARRTGAMVDKNKVVHPTWRCRRVDRASPIHRARRRRAGPARWWAGTALSTLRLSDLPRITGRRAARSLPFQFVLQELRQHHGVVVLFVPGGVEQRHPALADVIQQGPPVFRVGRQLSPIGFPEGIELLRVMAEGLAQLPAGRQGRQ